jgi:hypothetical protein
MEQSLLTDADIGYQKNSTHLEEFFLFHSLGIKNINTTFKCGIVAL